MQEDGDDGSNNLITDEFNSSFSSNSTSSSNRNSLNKSPNSSNANNSLASNLRYIRFINLVAFYFHFIIFPEIYYFVPFL